MSTDLPNLNLALVAPLRSRDDHSTRKPRILCSTVRPVNALSAACWLKSPRACSITSVQKRASSTPQDYRCPMMHR